MIGDSIGAAVGAEKARKEAAREAKRARFDRERALEMATDANYKPFLVSEQIGPYQRSQSPMARGFLESALSGANPAAVQGVRNGAPAMQQQAQDRFDQTTGGWDALRAQQQQVQQSTPWEVRPFEAPVTDDMRTTAKYGKAGRYAMQRLGITPDDVAALERLGITLDPTNGKLSGMNKDAKSEAKAIEKMGQDTSNGSLDRYLRALRGGGNSQHLARDIRDFTDSELAQKARAKESGNAIWWKS